MLPPSPRSPTSSAVAVSPPETQADPGFCPGYADQRRDPPLTYTPGRSNLDPYIAHLEARLTAGFEDAMALWREVRRLGYAGGRQMVQRWVAEHRSKPATRTARKWLRQALATTPSNDTSNRAAALPSPKQLA